MLRIVEFVTSPSDDAIVVLGEMVKKSLGLGDKINPAVLGQQWVHDVTETYWRLELANHEDRFGLGAQNAYGSSGSFGWAYG